MSHYWNIRCVDCGETLYIEVNRDVDFVRDLVESAEALAMLAERCPDARVGQHQVNFDPAFFLKHRGHRLGPFDEYGRLDGQCGKTVRCDCDGEHPCLLDAGHVGACSGVKVSEAVPDSQSWPPPAVKSWRCVVCGCFWWRPGNAVWAQYYAKQKQGPCCNGPNTSMLEAVSVVRSE